MYDLTPISPTIPIEYPAASPVRPTERPAAKCINPLDRYQLRIASCLPRYALLEQTVILPWRWPNVRCYENRNNERINGNDTGHDDGDE